MATCTSSPSELICLSQATDVRGAAADAPDEPLAAVRGIGYGLVFSIVFVWLPTIAVYLAAGSR